MLRIITMKAKEHSKIGKKKRLEDIEWIPFKTSRGMPDDFHLTDLYFIPRKSTGFELDPSQ